MFNDRAGGFTQLRYPDAVIIPLTQGKFAVVDKEIYPLVSNYRWHAEKGSAKHGLLWYARSSLADPIGMRYLHDLITPWEQTDHKNRDGLDCRMMNLRAATTRQNTTNRALMSNNTSGHVGIHWETARQKWRVSIGPNGPGHYRGGYSEFLDAIAVYHSAARELYGEFAPICCDQQRT
jgi:hypothetical protein